MKIFSKKKKATKQKQEDEFSKELTNSNKENQDKENEEIDSEDNDSGSSNAYEKKKIYKTVKENIKYIKEIQDKSWDLVTREITLDNKVQKLKIGLAFFAGLVDQQLLNKAVIDSIGHNYQRLAFELVSSDQRFDYFKDTLLTIIGVDDADDYGKLFNTLLSGDMIVFIEGVDKCIIIGARLYQERSIDKPTTQISVKGSNDAFNENLLTNVSLIRRRIKNPHLLVNNYIIGSESNTNVAVLYIKGIADEALVQRVTERIKAIKTTNVLDSSYISYNIKEKQFSMFPTQYDTERPDSTVANLYEGRVVVLVDTSPFAIILPAVFVQFLHSAEDYYQNAIAASFFRLLRLIALFISFFLPGLYICLILHHPELLPIKLLFNIAGQRINVPLPAFFELLLIMVAFDLLREAGTRMPTALGSTLSFVGAIIIGQSAVEAGLISPIIVIIVALTGIGSLLLPNYNLNITATIVRYLFTIVAILLGFYGLTLIFVMLIIHLSSLRSFGVDYFAPFGPHSKSGMQDSIIRFPMDKLFKRKQKSSGQFPH